MLEIHVDGDACPVKDEVLRVAERHGLVVHLVANSWLRHGGNNPLIHRVVVAEGADAADDWIADNIGPGDIAVTADIPLAARCLEKGAQALGPAGKPFTEQDIGMALAMRDLMSDLRDAGEIRGSGQAFSKQDRSRFLNALEQMVQTAKRTPPGNNAGSNG
ncbi:MAG: YaiI/YqxD family protein [Rhodospirillaceae bacterium]|nr:YaiI/YqxD family protein [Rhodospirillaceae bacterium]MBT6135875.1 YaiI/YqxD family protein [Rhodospirillaceae bacterium]